VATTPPAPLSAEQLHAIEQRVAVCTPGPWCHRLLGFIECCAEPAHVIGVTCQGHDPKHVTLPAADNAAFIAHAREDVPRLIAEVRRLHQRVKQLESSLREAKGAANSELVERT
jgi:hypothetical protein